MVNGINRESEDEISWRLVEAANANSYPAPDQNHVLQRNKWLAASCLQKSIRRGLESTAQSAAAALLSIDPEYPFTRLGVIAYEDIGLGNPELCAEVLLAKRKSIRRQVGDEQLLRHLVASCVYSIKDRTATDLLCLSVYDSHVDQLEHQCRTSTPEQLVEIALDDSLSWAQRSSACKCLAGYRKFDAGRYEVLSAPRMTFLMDVCEEMGVPPIVQYLVQAGHNKTAYLNTVLPLVHQLVSTSAAFTVNTGSFSTPRIGGIPATTFCMYTRDGKQAMAYYAKSCIPVRQFFEQHPNLRPVPVLGAMLFHIEGSLLDRSIDFDGRAAILNEIEFAEMAAVGIQDRQLVDELRELVQENMKSLNNARQKILNGAA